MEEPEIKSSEKRGRELSIDEQLALWVAGEPVHNSLRDECCPDFSCCQPDLLAPPAVREAFRDADEETRMGMLGIFLSASFDLASDKKVYIAGLDEGTA